MPVCCFLQVNMTSLLFSFLCNTKLETTTINASKYRHIPTMIGMNQARIDRCRRTSSSLSDKVQSAPFTTAKIDNMPTSSVPSICTSTERTYSTIITSSFSSYHSANNKPLNQVPVTAATPTKQPVRQQSKDAGSMDDEYGTMEASGKIYTHPTPYQLESFGMFGHYTTTKPNSNTPGKLQRGILNPAFLNYNTYGTLNPARDNVIVICHALTGNASLEAWWGELLGSGKAFDTDRYFIVCANILGSCYGSCGPSSLRPGCDENDGAENLTSNIPRDKSNRPIYGIDFPDVSVRDTVRLQLLMLKNELKINSIKCVIGGSFGGMQVMEYCAMAGATRPIGERADMMVVQSDMGGTPFSLGEFVSKRNGRIEPFVRSAVPIACGAAHTAWQIAISETQRQAIYADPKWNNGRIDANAPPNNGLSVARQIGMVSYRTPLGYQKKFGRALTDESGPSYGKTCRFSLKSNVHVGFTIHFY
jgi:homoserine O-acetyltransferase